MRISGRRSSGAGYEALVSSEDVLDTPNEYRHKSFQDTARPAVQGLVFVPFSCWVLANLFLAVVLVAVGVGETVTGAMIFSSYTTPGLRFGSCGAWWAGVSALFTGIAGGCVMCQFRGASPQRVASAEASTCGDSRRVVFALAGVSLVLCTAGAFVDGLNPGWAELRKIDSCSASSFEAYPSCSVGESAGSDACVCVDANWWAADEGCFLGKGELGGCETCGYGSDAFEVDMPDHCVSCADSGFEIDVARDDCTGTCVISGTAANPLISSSCQDGGELSCYTFEHVTGSCSGFLDTLLPLLLTSTVLCSIAALCSACIGGLAWLSCCSNRLAMEPVLIDRDVVGFEMMGSDAYDPLAEY